MSNANPLMFPEGRLTIKPCKEEDMKGFRQRARKVFVDIQTYNGISKTPALVTGINQLLLGLVSTEGIPDGPGSFDGWVCHIILSDDEVAEDEVRFLVQVSPYAEE